MFHEEEVEWEVYERRNKKVAVESRLGKSTEGRAAGKTTKVYKFTGLPINCLA